MVTEVADDDILVPYPITRQPPYTRQQERVLKDAAWSIVKGGKDVRDQFPHHYAWARAYLGLEDQRVVYGARAVNEEERDDDRVTR